MAPSCHGPLPPAAALLIFWGSRSPRDCRGTMTGLRSLFLRGSARVTLYSLTGQHLSMSCVLYPAWLDRRGGEGRSIIQVASMATLSLNVCIPPQEGGHLPAHPSSDVQESILGFLPTSLEYSRYVISISAWDVSPRTPRTDLGRPPYVDLKLVRPRNCGIGHTISAQFTYSTDRASSSRW